MTYALALEKAWQEILKLTSDKRHSVKLLLDTYEIDLEKKTVIAKASGAAAKEYVAIIILHYLAKRLTLDKLPELTGEWIDFNQLDGGEGYYPTFRKRTINNIIKKYGPAPEALFERAQSLGGERAETGDVGVAITILENVRILITIWKADDEFGPDANILFDKNISKIFCTEDVVVLTEYIVHLL